MPLELPSSHPSLIIRRQSFERVGFVRSAIDERLGLTDQEFRVEGSLIVVGPIFDSEALLTLIQDFESAGLVYYEDFFDVGGLWPDWLAVYIREKAP